jgi:hypothetical protein
MKAVITPIPGRWTPAPPATVKAVIEHSRALRARGPNCPCNDRRCTHPYHLNDRLT